MPMSPKEKQQAYRDRKKQAVINHPITSRCERLRRLLADFPAFAGKFDEWMERRNEEIRTKKARLA